MSVPAAAQRFGVGTVTVRRWLELERLDGIQRAERWVSEASVERVTEELRRDAATWISTVEAAELLGCSVKTIPEIVRKGLLVQRPGPRSRASINRGSVEEAARVLAKRRETAQAARQLREERRHRHHPPDDGTVWLSMKTTALLLGLSHSGVTMKVRAGTLSATKRGRRWWVRREDAERAAAARAFAAAHRDH